MPKSPSKSTTPDQAASRKRYLETLLDRITAPADVMRHHLQHQDQNLTLGLAAEAGVRDVLRMVLPQRFAVTSGFLRRQDGSLILPSSQKGDVSPQTDVIVYDASRACPLYSVNGIDIIAAEDALAIFEIKDSKNGEYDLDDALPHVASLAEHASAAFRGIILLQGRELSEKDNRETARECYEFESNVVTEIDLEGKGKRKTLGKKKRELKRTTVPHAVWCAIPGYVALREYMSNEVAFVGYEEDDPTLAFADFLRAVTSYFAAQGLSTCSMARGLWDDKPPKASAHPIKQLKLEDLEPVQSLVDLLNEEKVLTSSTDSGTQKESPKEENGKNYQDKLLKFVGSSKSNLEFFCLPEIGKSRDGRLSAGMMLMARWIPSASSEYSYAGAFFEITEDGVLSCYGDGDGDASAKPWIIDREIPEVYLKRICPDVQVWRGDPFRTPQIPERS